MQPTSKKYDSFSVYLDVDKYKYHQDHAMNVPGQFQKDVVYHEDPSMRPSFGWSQNRSVPFELDNMFRHYDKRNAHVTDRMKSLQEIQEELGGAESVSLMPGSRQMESTSKVSKFQLHSYIEQPAFVLRDQENTRPLDFPMYDPLAHVFNEVKRDLNTVDEVKRMYRQQFPDGRSRGEARHIPTFLQSTYADPTKRQRF